MTKSYVLSAFNCKLPEYFEEMYESFEKVYGRENGVITEEEISAVESAVELDKECFDVIRSVNAAFCKDELKHKAACLLRYVLLNRKPWQNLIYGDDVLSLEGFECESVNMLFVTCNLANTLINKKPPEELNKENLNAYVGYIRQCRDGKGYWGINEFNWNILCSGGCMFMCGALKFCPGEFTDDFPVLKKGNEYISLLKGEYRINSFGEIVGNDDEYEFTTCYEETDRTVKAHRITKEGRVMPSPESFSLDEYELFLKGGSGTLDFHIPSNMRYTPDVVADAYSKAVEFYKGFYPDFEIKAISGYSWIFSPQLDLALPENSNILAVRNRMHVLPTSGTYDETNRFIREGSSLQKRLADITKTGRKFHYAVIYVPVEEIAEFDE